MNVYRRFFRVTGGPLIEAIEQARKINDVAGIQYREILSEIGAKPEYYQRDGRLVGICFNVVPDRSIFKELEHTHALYPKKNYAKGRALLKRLGAVVTASQKDALLTVDLYSGPVLFGGDTCYYPTLTVIPSRPPVAYVSVPWYDEDPTVLEKYKEERAAGVRGDTNLDHIQWNPSADMEEVKEWEMMCHVDEWNSRPKVGGK